ncbi:hypothetical protein MKC48_03220 [[Clostridium] innocuum]|nr:hypothetical protein [Erysipelotrichaceae bacterium]MCR0622823.1 hypothetical protein [[Clostridium] innocuum]
MRNTLTCKKTICMLLCRCWHVTLHYAIRSVVFFSKLLAVGQIGAGFVWVGMLLNVRLFCMKMFAIV